MIQVQKTHLTLIRGLPTTRVANRGVEVRHLQGHTGTGKLIRGHPLDDVRTPAIGAATVGRHLGAEAVTRPVTLIVITAAADLADATAGERAAHHRPGHVRQHVGAGRPRGGISVALGIGGMIIGGDEPFCIA